MPEMAPDPAKGNWRKIAPGKYYNGTNMFVVKMANDTWHVFLDTAQATISGQRLDSVKGLAELVHKAKMEVADLRLNEKV